MTEYRRLAVKGGKVACKPDKQESLERCRFCVHSRNFFIRGHWITSPARAYCVLSRGAGTDDISPATMVECDDTSGEGFRSFLNVIS